MSLFRALGRNLPYLRQQFSALLGNTSTSVKFICGVVLISYCLSYNERAVDVVSVTPGYLLPPSFWLWTAFTFCFLEVHFWEVLVDIVTVGLCGKLIEPLWGQIEMMTFFAVVNIGVAVISTTFYLLLYMCTTNTDLLFSVHIHGLAGYIAGVSVAVKQIMPDLVLIKTPLGKLSNRNVPLIVFFLTLIVWLVGLLEGTYPTMFLAGLLVSWVYLRFYQRHSNGSKGDMADYFTFASFFPNVIQPPIAVFSNTVYGCFVRAGICRKFIRRFDMANPTGITISVPGQDPHDMERRRQIALKALSERLSKSSSSQQDKQPLLPIVSPNTLNSKHQQQQQLPLIAPVVALPSTSQQATASGPLPPPLAPITSTSTSSNPQQQQSSTSNNSSKAATSSSSTSIATPLL